MADEPEKPKLRHGGPRPKVRATDRRGVASVGGANPHTEQHVYDPKIGKKVRELGMFISIGAVAKRVGLSRNTLYRYYKDDIEAAIADMEADLAGRCTGRRKRLSHVPDLASPNPREMVESPRLRAPTAVIQHIDLSKLTDERAGSP